MSGFDLAAQVRGSVGEASIASMNLGGARTIETITDEILRLKTDAGNAIIGIGQRLIEAKELLSHGEWLPWLTEQAEFSERTAQDFMRLAREWSNPQTLADLGKAEALKLLLLPPAEREEFMEAHDVPNMSTRELEQALRERDEAVEAAKKSEELLEIVNAEACEYLEQAEDAERRAEEAEARVRELEARPVDVAVEVDGEAVKRAADEARRAAETEWRKKVEAAKVEARRAAVEEWQKKTSKLSEDLRKAEEKAKAAAEKAKERKQAADAGQAASAELDAAKKAADEAKAETERLRAELERAKQAAANAAVTSDADLAVCVSLAEQIRECANKLNGVRLKARNQGDEIKAAKLNTLILRIAEDVRGCAE